jgi:hypothetical protein
VARHGVRGAGLPADEARVRDLAPKKPAKRFLEILCVRRSD